VLHQHLATVSDPALPPAAGTVPIQVRTDQDRAAGPLVTVRQAPGRGGNGPECGRRSARCIQGHDRSGSRPSSGAGISRRWPRRVRPLDRRARCRPGRRKRTSAGSRRGARPRRVAGAQDGLALARVGLAVAGDCLAAPARGVRAGQVKRRVLLHVKQAGDQAEHRGSHAETDITTAAAYQGQPLAAVGAGEQVQCARRYRCGPRTVTMAVTGGVRPRVQTR
jgi:hypothetical protein